MTAIADTRPPLSCAEVIRLVTDYFEESLATGDRARFEAHIADCPGCSAYLEQWRTMIRITGRLAEGDVDAESKQRLMDAFRGWQTTPPARPSLLTKLRQLFRR